jgi:hypothetical protein
MLLSACDGGEKRNRKDRGGDDSAPVEESEPSPDSASESRPADSAPRSHTGETGAGCEEDAAGEIPKEATWIILDGMRE